MEKKNGIILSIVVIVLGMAIVGGTYAWFGASITTNNESYVIDSECFLIDYGVNNDDNSVDITGTMFPASGPLRPGTLSGKVTMKTNSACNINGIGTLTVHINGGTNTSSVFGSTVAAHCENPTTLQTLKDYKTQSDCTSHDGSWVTNGTALKYAVYETNTSGDPVSVGYITSSMIGGTADIYTDFGVTDTLKTYYIYLWLDGYNSNSSAEQYVDIPFSGYISAFARQAQASIPPEYQQVEYIGSSGSQCINTNINGNNSNLGFDVKYSWITLPASTGYHAVFATYQSENHVTTRLLQYGSSITYYNINSKAGGGSGSITQTRTTNTIYTDSLHSSGNTMIYATNGNTVSTARVSGTNSTNKLYIFSSNSSSSKSSIKLYYLRLYDNNTLIRSFVPVYRKVDNVIGLYDSITNTFYTNDCTGTFTKGSNVSY